MCLRCAFWHALLRALLCVDAGTMTLLRRIGRRPRPLREGKLCEVLLTGTFYSENWVAAHLRPLAESNVCRRVVVVSRFPIPRLPKVVAVYPPRPLRRQIGSVPARLLTFGWLALRRRPDAVGGFHLLVNGLAAIKRIDVFLRAVSIVAQRVPDVTSIIVGDGELRDELRALAERLGLNGRVRFAGYRTDVAELLRRARLFVLTSDSEGLALSLMEAMTCGLPAVVTDVGDLADLVEDGVNGYLVPRRSPEALAERIVELLSDDAKRERFARAARRAAERCGTPHIARRWDDILGDLGRDHPAPEAV